MRPKPTHREIARKASDLPGEVKELLPRLRDPSFTRVLLVTLPEATPVHEAASLQADLKRAQIEPFAWVINQSMARAQTKDPVAACPRKGGDSVYSGSQPAVVQARGHCQLGSRGTGWA